MVAVRNNVRGHTTPEPCQFDIAFGLVYKDSVCYAISSSSNFRLSSLCLQANHTISPMCAYFSVRRDPNRLPFISAPRRAVNGYRINIIVLIVATHIR